MSSTNSSSARRLRLVVTNGARSWGGNEAFALQVAQRLHERGHGVLFLWGFPAVGDRVRAAGVPDRRLRLRADLDVVGLADLTNHLRRERADAVLLTKWREFFLGSLAAKLAGVPVVALRLGLKMTPKNDLKRRLVFRLADHVIVNAQDIRDHLVTLPFVDPRKVAVIHNGIDLRRFQPDGDRRAFRAEIGIDEATPLVGSVGSLFGQKGYEHLIEAARQVPKAVFVVLGEGNQRADLERRVGAAQLESRFLLPGFRDDVRPFLAALDVFVLSSVNEGMARVLLEAMACGLPIVATDVSGTRACVMDGENGYVVPPADARALADSVRGLLDDPSRRRVMGRTSRRLAEERFAEEGMVRAVESLLASPAGRGNERRPDP